ncbi:RdgB/HAM1 family non-canonical purine NTP pyrophosphatase [Solitalea canadensis]|uniref:dITP/XTP pyrophosphatase n=1 Tax=Solitalea canadensis (strain ATCC 29591 / DSM 3403 / JCM 21819 / LMG 8368 / NBRC 15130 / NCIMB 12057 / USAM 9D) TaxID=929556 RepID=H8KWU0_SOLCM|nr:RdgB/HAM1 family non-canonical purine NTP pyrophosphatase [Solitalea canadensis]AFD08269.1 non-canonical purine NTP pyrophosphatase, rdgB/HAM1 family [Solitalea canadensis DSM 3403]
MSSKLVFATNNLHKLEEVNAMLNGAFELLTLEQIGCDVDIPETGETFEENAGQKSWYVYNNYNMNCFGDDSGLVVDALNGEPGVYSARYSGTRDHDKNIDLLLKKLEGKENRAARFKAVISLVLGGKEHLFEGTVEGTIRHARSGTDGFGYDPIFQADGYTITFAEMGMDEKNAISHRGRAVEKLVNFLKTQ